MNKLLLKELKLNTPWWGYGLCLLAFWILNPSFTPFLGNLCFLTGLMLMTHFKKANHDDLYQQLLPCSTLSAKKAKLNSILVLELLHFLFSLLCVILRMTVLKGQTTAGSSFMQQPNFCYLGEVLILDGLFNLVFITAELKNTQNPRKPFALFLLIAFALITLSEGIAHLEAFAFLNDMTAAHLLVQYALLCFSALIFILLNSLASVLLEKHFKV